MHIVELTGEESITAIYGLIEAADDDIVLVVPKGCEALERNEVNLRLLRRWGDNLSRRIGLVVADRATQVMAREAGFLLFSSPANARRADIAALDRRRRRLAGLPQRPSPGLALESLGHKASTRAGRSRFRRAGVILAAGCAAILGLAFVALFALPSATVTLQPISQRTSAAMEVTGVLERTDIDYSQALVPARMVTIDQDGFDTVATTNKRDVPDGHAQGTVLFANRTTVPMTITKGTVVRTSYGESVRFYTIADVRLPGELYGTVRVGVLAAEPGPSGNVPALTINIVEGPVAAQADVLNESRITGGTVRRLSTVAAADKVTLRSKLMQGLQEEAYKALTASLREKEFVPPGSLDIRAVSEEFDHKVDDMVDQLGMSMTVNVRGLAVDGHSAEQVILALIQQRTRDGYRLLSDSVNYERGAVISATLAQALFGMSAQAYIVPDIELDEVRAAVAGLSVDNAKTVLSRKFDLSTQPEISLSGSLLGRLPIWTRRIYVRVVAD